MNIFQEKSLSIKEQIVLWQNETISKGCQNTLISNLLCELSRYDKEIETLTLKG